MNESEIIKIIRRVVRQELAPIMMASLVSNQDQFRSTVKRFSNDPPISNLRNLSPYGFASRATSNTDALVVPVDGNATHLNIVGYFDEKRPAINDGESILYGADGQVVYMKAGGTIHQGVQTAESPVVLGDVLKTFCENVLNAFLNASQIGECAVGPVMLDPGIRTILAQELSEHVDAASTNFLGQKNFVGRGV